MPRQYEGWINTWHYSPWLFCIWNLSACVFCRHVCLCVCGSRSCGPVFGRWSGCWYCYSLPAWFVRVRLGLLFDRVAGVYLHGYWVVSVVRLGAGNRGTLLREVNKVSTTTPSVLNSAPDCVSLPCLCEHGVYLSHLITFHCSISNCFPFTAILESEEGYFH